MDMSENEALQKFPASSKSFSCHDRVILKTFVSYQALRAPSNLQCPQLGSLSPIRSDNKEGKATGQRQDTPFGIGIPDEMGSAEGSGSSQPNDVMV